jgi:hypothetical protein
VFGSFYWVVTIFILLVRILFLLVKVSILLARITEQYNSFVSGVFLCCFSLAVSVANLLAVIGPNSPSRLLQINILALFFQALQSQHRPLASLQPQQRRATSFGGGASNGPRRSRATMVRGWQLFPTKLLFSSVSNPLKFAAAFEGVAHFVVVQLW